MKVPDLIDEVRRQVPVGAPFGTRHKASGSVNTAHGAWVVAAAARIDREGRRREQFWCDGLRLELPVLLRLTCSESECPHAVQVRAQWLAFHRRSALSERSGAFQPRPLMTEVDLNVGWQRITARPARFPCFTPCPNKAHPPMTVHKAGFDLFAAGQCVGGGVVEVRGVRRPRIPTVRAAEAYLLARGFEATAAIQAAHDAAGRPPGPAGRAV